MKGTARFGGHWIKCQELVVEQAVGEGEADKEQADDAPHEKGRLDVQPIGAHHLMAEPDSQLSISFFFSSFKTNHQSSCWTHQIGDKKVLDQANMSRTFGHFKAVLREVQHKRHFSAVHFCGVNLSVLQKLISTEVSWNFAKQLNIVVHMIVVDLLLKVQ